MMKLPESWTLPNGIRVIFLPVESEVHTAEFSSMLEAETN
jgi:hypothetical protein